MQATEARPQPYRVDVFERDRSYFIDEKGDGYLDGDVDRAAEFRLKREAVAFAKQERAKGNAAVVLKLIKAQWVDADPEGWWDTDYDSGE